MNHGKVPKEENRPRMQGGSLFYVSDVTKTPAQRLAFQTADKPR
ncbi:hypothetical protein YPPY34_2974 [Yersinia pestis PY-34]|nr:hypothetical protein YPPY34_2974 [Yersinia pestis PY-34]